MEKTGIAEYLNKIKPKEKLNRRMMAGLLPKYF